MTAHEIFSRLSPGTAATVLEWLMEHDKPAYKAAIGLLAGRRKLRPVFVERKPRAERNAWLAEVLAKGSNDDLATEILQAWILGGHREMVTAFLDELKVPHDGNGLIETLPAEPAGSAIDSAVEGLFAKFPHDAVFVYLNLFAGMDIANWPHLRALVTGDARLNPSLQAA